MATERCQNYQVEVWGSAKKPYVVSIIDGELKCTCVAWAIENKRQQSDNPTKFAPKELGVFWCKHTRTQIDNLCGWVGDPMVPGHCDECLGPTEVLQNESAS